MAALVVALFLVAGCSDGGTAIRVVVDTSGQDGGAATRGEYAAPDGGVATDSTPAPAEDATMPAGDTMPNDAGMAVDRSGNEDAAPPGAGPSPAELAYGCPRDEALRLCFTFDDLGTSTRLTDRSEHGNHGFLNSAEVASGVAGYALSFRAGSHRAGVPDNQSLRLAETELTFEAWIRPTMSAPDLAADIILGKVDTDLVGWAFALYGTDIRLYVNGNTARGASGVLLGFWNHVAIVLRPAGVLVYINGKQVGGELPPLPIPLKTVPVTIGNTNPNIPTLNPTRSGYTGELDVVRIYARAKRPEEICADAGGSWADGACDPRAFPLKG